MLFRRHDSSALLTLLDQKLRNDSPHCNFLRSLSPFAACWTVVPDLQSLQRIHVFFCRAFVTVADAAVCTGLHPSFFVTTHRKFMQFYETTRTATLQAESVSRLRHELGWSKYGEKSMLPPDRDGTLSKSSSLRHLVFTSTSDSIRVNSAMHQHLKKYSSDFRNILY